MKPLSDDDAAGLFYGRIFSGENRCPSELEEVSRNILKKCAGVPLAIITIASLLASNQRIKSKDQWNVLLDSFGRGLNIEDDSMKEMKMILSLSYYDLPSYMRTCLLYLSIYPEDWVIERDQLIWKWIAERFIHCENEEADLFELGESCFNELINRSMIQPIYDHGGSVNGCHVHDMILDLICSMSNEENFVTVEDGLEGNISSQRKIQRKIRRLSLQNRRKDRQTTPLYSMSISQVRSITIFQPAVNIILALSSCDALRVLDLCGLDNSRSCHLNLTDVGNLLNLRYLNLKNTGITELPPEIGNLQFLQVLDVSGNRLGELPSTFIKLKRLKFLSYDMLWNRFVNLTCMEVLKTLNVNNLNVVKDLGNLARLRELTICFSGRDLEVEKAFVESLCNLQHIQSLILRSPGFFESMDLLRKKWMPSQHLCLFDASNVVHGAFSVMPAWLQRDPSHLSNLSDLSIRIKVLQQEDVQILGRLSALRNLLIQCTHQAERLLLVSGADGFHCIISFRLYLKSSTQIVFGQGALPNAEYVDLSSGVLVARQDSNADHFDFGLGNLLSLQRFRVSIYRHRITVGDAKKVEAAVRNTLSAHPNHPGIFISMEPPIEEGAHDDDLCEYKEYEEPEDR